jgi:inosose dehydratase
MFSKKDVKLGIAPIAWTNDDLTELGAENTFEQCVSEMALAGFEGSEIGNKYPKDVNVLKKALDMRGIQICNMWFSSYFTSHPKGYTAELFEKDTDFLRDMGARVIGISEQGDSIQGKMKTPILTEKPIWDENTWDKVINGINSLVEIAERKGIQTAYHHHMGTGIQTMEEIDRFMKKISSKVELIFDTGHAVFSKINPLEIIEKYKNRIAHVHLKNIRKDIIDRVKNEKLSFLDAVKKGAFTVPGDEDGMIDFAPIFKALSKANYQGWFVVEAEQDPAIANPFEYALKARKYIKEQTSL